MKKVKIVIKKVLDKAPEYYRTRIFRENGISRLELVICRDIRAGERFFGFVLAIILPIILTPISIGVYKNVNFVITQNCARGAIVVEAERLRLLCIPYLKGGKTDPHTGLDCSGYVAHVINNVSGFSPMIYFMNNSVKQMYKKSKVRGFFHKHKPRVGDIVFISPSANDKFGHIGLVISVLKTRKAFWYIHHTKKPIAVLNDDKSIKKYMHTKRVFIDREGKKWTGKTDFHGVVEGFGSILFKKTIDN